jgi:ABC-type dipeptide/oligopeptide/nickel transport system ATPase component
MILNIRGTSGSGKSTAVRAIMALSTNIMPIKADPVILGKKRKNPLAYLMECGGARVGVMGHYAADCGGCDTLPNYELTFELIKERHRDGYHVLFEGLLVAHDKKQCKALWEWLGRKDFAILELTETLETCLSSVRERRARKGADPDTFNPQNTIRRYQEVVRSCQQLEEHGIPVHRVTREQCVPKITELLGLKLQEIAA